MPMSITQKIKIYIEKLKTIYTKTAIALFSPYFKILVEVSTLQV